MFSSLQSRFRGDLGSKLRVAGVTLGLYAPLAAILVSSGVSERVVVVMAFIISLTLPPVLLWLERATGFGDNQKANDNSINIRPKAEISPHLRGWQASVKRVVDIALSLFVFIFALPVLLLLSLAVKLGGPGPIFYRVERQGYKQRTFFLIRFRTISTIPLVDASPDIYSAPSMTELGRFLRKTRLDELPQFWNILWGQMSLIGPRAMRHDLDFSIGGWSNLLSEVRPGIIGLADVVENSRQRKLTDQHAILWDAYYVSHWSLGLDLRIYWWWLRSIFSGRNDPPKFSVAGKSVESNEDPEAGQILVT